MNAETEPPADDDMVPIDVPIPDAVEQATPVTDEAADPVATFEHDAEVPEADALDQAREVPLDDDWDR
jgi:hypothetical protein